MRNINGDAEWLVRSYPWLVMAFVMTSLGLIVMA